MNRLSQQTSPYLLQHADNPVDWHPWGPEALQLAQQTSKPILLSVGYSACHWCHVMAHESFENPSIAALMNEFFVCIKVDREERPDIDRIYQTAHLFLTRNSGGWPLTMFLTPDQQPFFGGTYFPPEPRQGQPGFVELLQRVNDYYSQHGDEIHQQNQALQLAMLQSEAGAPISREEITAEPLHRAGALLRENFDSHHGGFGGAPKFPHVPSLELCLRLVQQDEKFLQIAIFSLDKMVNGGLNDQVGGGFFRYCVDDRWQVPHFEKMLYDNGLLLTLLSQASVANRSGRYHRVIEETGRWVIREMQSPDGGYYSSLDADSAPPEHTGEKVEGAFYTWTQEEIEALLTKEELAVANKRLGLDQPANFAGRWHPTIQQTPEQLAAELNISTKRAVVLITGVMQKLHQARQLRHPPGRDEKILTAWNGLMIRGMALAGRETGQQSFIDSAERALTYLRNHHWQEGQLLATSHDGHAHLNGYLDDYVMAMDGILALLQCRWRSDEFEFLQQLAERVLSHFQATDETGNGTGLHFTADDHERLILRTRPFADDSLPAGNGVAARVFGLLHHLTGETRYGDLQRQILCGGWQPLSEMPMAHCGLLAGLQDYLDPPSTVVVRTSSDATLRWQQTLRTSMNLRGYGLVIADQSEPLPGLLAERKTMAGQAATAYRCKGFHCYLPVHDQETLETTLGID
ncbi:MAG: thioredoxin domain-containing protein [Gammaproteobacteria bacterium]|nr:MAG: thioredoxin domain-containing protein [Gammaproteobacteria bacterium]RLA15305.1 MAG: thioredoxin domain-containing protein [Gammaproteobacteria bacterium]